ncbi:MAG: hypothetical protein KatS3mg095_0725 [Candidatus Parcubacteria bacterium]|nr:MAG: hypothetical protein KatS3mg095_0725 [Candidatus Parcubacteria bacterium]
MIIFFLFVIFNVRTAEAQRAWESAQYTPSEVYSMINWLIDKIRRGEIKQSSNYSFYEPGWFSYLYYKIKGFRLDIETKKPILEVGRTYNILFPKVCQKRGGSRNCLSFGNVFPYPSFLTPQLLLANLSRGREASCLDETGKLIIKDITREEWANGIIRWTVSQNHHNCNIPNQEFLRDYYYFIIKFPVESEIGIIDRDSALISTPFKFRNLFNYR